MNPLVVVIPLLVLAVGFVVFCLVDLARAKEVRYLPKWVWAILCMGGGLTIPFGGLAYLVFGKVRRPRPSWLTAWFSRPRSSDLTVAELTDPIRRGCHTAERTEMQLYFAMQPPVITSQPSGESSRASWRP